MPRPVKIAERYKKAFAALTVCPPDDRASWLGLLSELQGLCECVDQTAERLYRLERELLSWSGTSRADATKGDAFHLLPRDGSAFSRMVHEAMNDDDDGGSVRRG